MSIESISPQACGDSNLLIEMSTVVKDADLVNLGTVSEETKGGVGDKFECPWGRIEFAYELACG